MLIFCLGLLEFEDNTYRFLFMRFVRAVSVWLLKGPPDRTGAMDSESQDKVVYDLALLYTPDPCVYSKLILCCSCRYVLQLNWNWHYQCFGMCRPTIFFIVVFSSK